MSLAEFFPHLVVDWSNTLPGAGGPSGAAVFDTDRVYRYALLRRWAYGPLALWVMLNPSTADAFSEDSTSRRVISFSRAWHCGGMIAVNLFGLRSTDPRALRTHDSPVGPDNDRVISWHLSADGPLVGPVVAAWGVHGALNGRDQKMLQLLAEHGRRVRCLGLTSKGHPRDPLYVPNSATLTDFTGRAAVAPLSVPETAARPPTSVSCPPGSTPKAGVGGHLPHATEANRC